MSCRMSRVSPVPPLNLDLHLVLCDFGRSGLAYVETDPAQADATTIVRNLLRGEYDRPLRIIAVNAEEEWSRDVSESIAAKVQDVAEHEARELTSGTLAFIDAHLAHARQPTLPLLPSLWPPCCELARLSFADRGRIRKRRPVVASPMVVMLPARLADKSPSQATRSATVHFALQLGNRLSRIL